MTAPAKRTIAIIGTKDQVDLMRLAGVDHYRIVEGDGRAEEDFLEALAAFVSDPAIGVIMIPRNARVFLQGLPDAGARLTPIFVELPELKVAEDIGAYYRNYARKLLGIAVEL